MHQQPQQPSSFVNPSLQRPEGNYQRGRLAGGTLKRMIKKKAMQPRFPSKLASMVSIHARHLHCPTWPKLETAPEEAAK